MIDPKEGISVIGTSFERVLESTRAANIGRVLERLSSANRLAKTLNGAERAKAYAVKARAGARALELGAARWSGEVVLGRQSILYGVQCENGARVHLPESVLSPAAVSLLRQQGAARMIGAQSYASLGRQKVNVASGNSSCDQAVGQDRLASAA
jgi:hypothetical protein